MNDCDLYKSQKNGGRNCIWYTVSNEAHKNDLNRICYQKNHLFESIDVANYVHLALFIHLNGILGPCFRQVKLEEGLMSSGRMTDALQSLLDWLSKAETYLVQDQPILGDLDTVTILIEKHKVGSNLTV